MWEIYSLDSPSYALDIQAMWEILYQDKGKHAPLSLNLPSPPSLELIAPHCKNERLKVQKWELYIQSSQARASSMPEGTIFLGIWAFLGGEEGPMFLSFSVRFCT